MQIAQPLPKRECATIHDYIIWHVLLRRLQQQTIANCHMLTIWSCYVDFSLYCLFKIASFVKLGCIMLKIHAPNALFKLN